jgi:hypothetical protein
MTALGGLTSYLGGIAAGWQPPNRGISLSRLVDILESQHVTGGL